MISCSLCAALSSATIGACRFMRIALPPELVHGPLTLGIVHFAREPKSFNAIEHQHWRKSSFFFRPLPMLVRYRLNARRLLRPVESALRRIEV